MKDTLLYILEKLVDHPKDVRIEEEAGGDRIVFVVHLHPDDMGRVIGKNGRIIRAVRDLVKLMATKQNAYVDVVLAEEAA